MPELKKTKGILLKTKDSVLNTKEGLLKTEDILLKTKDSPSVNSKLLTHILTNVPSYQPTHMQTSDLDDYNKFSLWLSLKINIVASMYLEETKIFALIYLWASSWKWNYRKQWKLPL